MIRMRTVYGVLAAGLLGTLLGVWLLPDKWGYGLVGFFSAHLVLGATAWFQARDRV